MTPNEVSKIQLEAEQSPGESMTDYVKRLTDHIAKLDDEIKAHRQAAQQTPAYQTFEAREKVVQNQIDTSRNILRSNVRNSQGRIKIRLREIETEEGTGLPGDESASTDESSEGNT